MQKLLPQHQFQLLTTAIAIATYLNAYCSQFDDEFETQIIEATSDLPELNKIPLDEVDWTEIAISAAVGAVSGLAMFGTGILAAKKMYKLATLSQALISGMSGGTVPAVNVWLQGGSLNEILLAFSIGFATGVLIFGACKVAGQVAKRVAMAKRAGSDVGNAIERNQLDNVRVAESVKRKMGIPGDRHHGFPNTVDRFGADGTLTNFRGADGQAYRALHIRGAINGRQGFYEYIIRVSDNTLTHRHFTTETMIEIMSRIMGG